MSRYVRFRAGLGAAWGVVEGHAIELSPTDGELWARVANPQPSLPCPERAGPGASASQASGAADVDCACLQAAGSTLDCGRA